MSIEWNIDPLEKAPRRKVTIGAYTYQTTEDCAAIVHSILLLADVLSDVEADIDYLGTK